MVIYFLFFTSLRVIVSSVCCVIVIQAVFYWMVWGIACHMCGFMFIILRCLRANLYAVAFTVILFLPWYFQIPVRYICREINNNYVCIQPYMHHFHTRIYCENWNSVEIFMWEIEKQLVINVEWNIECIVQIHSSNETTFIMRCFMSFFRDKTRHLLKSIVILSSNQFMKLTLNDFFKYKL